MHLHQFIERQVATVAKVSTYAHHHRRALIIRSFLGLAAIVAVVFLAKILDADVSSIEAWIRAQGAWMPVVFGIIFFVATLFCLPADVFVFLAGTLFGLWWGFLMATVVEYIALIVQFYIARGVFKDRIQHFLSKHKRFDAIDKAISQDGIRIGFLLRLGPVPFAPLNYVLGVSRITFRTYMLASPGMIPSLFPVVYYGFVARHLTDLATGNQQHGWIHYVSLIVSLFVIMFLTIYIAKVARKALREAEAEA